MPPLHAAASEALSGQKTRRVLVYDLLNAGPRHRFTVSGKIVSNSYCLGPEGYARNAKVSVEQAEQDMARFFQRYARIGPFREEFWAACRARATPTCPPHFINMFGRPRRIPGLLAKSGFDRGRAERQAIGSLIQGTAAELTKEALVRIWRWEQQAHSGLLLCSTIHDEISFDCAKKDAHAILQAVVPMLETFPQFDPIPILTDSSYSDTNWSEKKKFEKGFVTHVWTKPQ